MNFSLTAALLATSIGAAGSLAGVYLRIAHGGTRLLVPVSGVILLAVSLFSILPEMAGEAGWVRTGALYLLGYSLLFVIDRYLHPVCPSCAPDHDHGDCEVELHGFSIPLLIATSIHAFIDGWGMTVAQNAGSSSISIAVLLHKIPEGLALGVMLRASLRSRAAAAGWGLAAESSTAVGAILAMSILSGVNDSWARDLLTIAGGTFLYLGFHAVHGIISRSLLPIWRRL